MKVFVLISNCDNGQKFFDGVHVWLFSTKEDAVDALLNKAQAVKQFFDKEYKDGESMMYIQDDNMYAKFYDIHNWDYWQLYIEEQDLIVKES